MARGNLITDEEKVFLIQSFIKNQNEKSFLDIITKEFNDYFNDNKNKAIIGARVRALGCVKYKRKPKQESQQLPIVDYDGKIEHLDNDGIINLCEAMFKQIRVDYKAGRNKQLIKKFLEQGWISSITGGKVDDILQKFSK